MPRGVVHSFRNASQAPARHLVVHAPVDALDGIEAIAAAARDQWGEVFARHHSRLLGG